MHATEFFRDVVCSEAACLEFLRKCGVLAVDDDMSCPGKRDGIDCGGKMKTSWVTRRQGTKIPTFQCRKRRCRRKVTVRSWNHLFHHPLDAQGRLPSKLTLCNIMVLLYIFLDSKQGTIDEAVQKTGHGKATVVEWFAHFPETMGKAMDYEGRLVGTSAKPVQVDGSYFRGRRKYRRGRLLVGDTTEKKKKSGNDGSESDSSDDENELEWGGRVEDDDVDEKDEDVEENAPAGKNNYKKQVNGPWVVGFYQSERNVRFVIVIPHDMRDENEKLCWEGVRHLNSWRMRQVLHAKRCKNADSDPKSKRSSLLSEYGKLPLSNYASKYPVVLPKKRRARDVDKETN